MVTIFKQQNEILVSLTHVLFARLHLCDLTKLKKRHSRPNGHMSCSTKGHVLLFQTCK